MEKDSRLVKRPNSVGIRPTRRMLLSKLSDCKCVRRYISVGISLENSLYPKSSSLRDVARPSSGVMGPSKLLLSRRRVSRFLAFPISRGIEPRS
jgi:hypothetical protein